MWIDRKQWDALQQEVDETRGTNKALERAYASLEATMDWMRMRMTQCELERAKAMEIAFGMKVEVPSIQKAPDFNIDEQSVNGQGLSFFMDMGDEEAKKQGLGWDSQGNLVQAKNRG